MAKSQLDILSRLMPWSFRHIQFPAMTSDFSFGHRLVEHKQHGVAGAHIENTGRNAIRFSAKIPFYASIGDYSDLYPGKYREFLNAFLDPSIGPLQHPELGVVDVRPGELAVHTDPNKRSGYEVDASWIETNEDAGEIFKVSPNGMIDEAITLSQSMEDAYNKVPQPPDKFDGGNGLSCSEMLKSLKGQFMLAQMEIGALVGQIGSIVNALNSLIDAFSLSGIPEAWPVLEYAKDVESRLNSIVESLPSLKKVKKVDLRFSPIEEPLGESAARFSMKLEEFVALNPRYAASGTVPSGGDVWVYA
jgi:hypothetical protein